MKQRSTLTAGAVISALIGVLIGNFIKNLPEYFGLSDLIGVIFIMLGVFTLISSIPELIFAISRFGTVGGVLNLISASLGVISGFVLIFFHNEIVLTVVAAYLVVLPLIQIIFAGAGEKRRSAVKALAPKIVIGILLIAFFPAATGIANAVFAIILTCVGWGIIGLSLLFLAVSLFILYIRPLFSKKRQKDDSTIYLDDEDFNDKNN